MAQRVTGKEIEITVDVCRFSVKTSTRISVPCVLVTVSRKGKPCPLVFSSSKVNCTFGLIEFKNVCETRRLDPFLNKHDCRQHSETTIWEDTGMWRSPFLQFLPSPGRLKQE